MPNIHARLYVGAMNDGLFIIDEKPRPSNDDKADMPRVNVIAKMADNSPRSQRIAEIMVSAYNDAVGHPR